MSAYLKRHPLFLAAALAFGLALAAHAADPPRIIPGIIMQYPQATGYVDVRVLAAGVAETVTVPAKCDWIVFAACDATACASSATFFLRADGQPATVPSADVTDGTGSALSPSARRFVPGATFSLIAPAAAKVTLECYDFPDEG